MASSSYAKYVQIKMRAAFYGTLLAENLQTDEIWLSDIPNPYGILLAENLQADEIWLSDIPNPKSKQQYTVNNYCSVAMDNERELIQHI
jgi:hypothetical protein